MFPEQVTATNLANQSVWGLQQQTGDEEYNILYYWWIFDLTYKFGVFFFKNSVSGTKTV